MWEYNFFIIGISYMLGIMSPGPSMVLIANNSVCYTRKSGIITALGVLLAILVQVLCALLFINYLKTQVLIFQILKVCCSGYLIYLGYKLLFKVEGEILKSTEDTVQRNFFKEGFFIELLNPIALAFFLTIFAMHVKDIENVYIHILYLLEVFLLGALWFISVAYFLSLEKMHKVLSKYILIIKKMAGMFFIFYGFKFIFDIEFPLN